MAHFNITAPAFPPLPDLIGAVQTATLFGFGTDKAAGCRLQVVWSGKYRRTALLRLLYHQPTQAIASQHLWRSGYGNRFYLHAEPASRTPLPAHCIPTLRNRSQGSHSFHDLAIAIWPAQQNACVPESQDCALVQRANASRPTSVDILNIPRRVWTLGVSYLPET